MRIVDPSGSEFITLNHFMRIVDPSGSEFITLNHFLRIVDPTEFRTVKPFQKDCRP